MPNIVMQNRGLKEAAIVLKRSPDGNAFALGVNTLNYYLEAMKSGRCTQCWVVLLEPDGEYIKAETLRNVQHIVNGTEPNPTKEPEEGWSDYWWVTDQWQVSIPGRGARRILGDDAAL